jgi:hypothetical protein
MAMQYQAFFSGKTLEITSAFHEPVPKFTGVEEIVMPLCELSLRLFFGMDSVSVLLKVHKMECPI